MTAAELRALDLRLRIFAPIWLDAIGLDSFAGRLRALPEISDEKSSAAALELADSAAFAAMTERLAWDAWSARHASIALYEWQSFAHPPWYQVTGWDGRASWAAALIVAGRAGAALASAATDRDRVEAGKAALNEVIGKILYVETVWREVHNQQGEHLATK